MNKALFLTGILLTCYISNAQNDFDKRIKDPKKTYSGVPIQNAETIRSDESGNPIPGYFPMKHLMDKKFKDYEIVWDEREITPIHIKPQFSWFIESSNKDLLNHNYADGIPKALSKISALIQIGDPEKELLLNSINTDELGITHARYQQVYEMYMVQGGDLIVHYRDNQILSVSNRLYPSPKLKPSDLIPKAVVIQKIVNEMPAEPLNEIGESLLKDKRLISSTIVYHKDMNPFLEKVCYKIEYRPNLLDWWEFIVDAANGNILSAINKTCSIDGPRTASALDLNSITRTINTYELGGNFYLLNTTKPMFNASQSSLPNKGVGVVRTLDANFTSGASLFNITSTNNTWNSSRSGVSAHFNASVAFDYYKNTHNRNSINGSGGNVVSIVNVNDKNGAKLDNAYWNGEMMFYGNGNTAFTPLAGSLDVGGHEMTHGVVQNSANLEYNGQSGAINESMADVFGSLLDRDDWQIGEDITKTSYIPSGALRDLSNPHNGRTSLSQAGYQPMNMNEFYTGTADNGGVHINSGIPNHAYYLIANSSVGKDKAERIYYRALTVYLTSQSQFVDLRFAIIKSAEDLFGNGSNEAFTAVNAFNTVKIFGYNGTGGGGSTGSGEGEVILTPNNGNESIISYNTDFSFSGTFYTSTTSGTGFKEKSQTDAKRRASVTDNGSFAYFVSDIDSRIKGFSLSGSPNETYVSAFGDEFDNAAISKDGKHLAAVSTDVDSSIYVYDFTLKAWKQFKLYNPTFSEGVETGGVLYADGLEWDYSGQFIVYDAKNILKGNFGTDISWWDIGIIRVWDNEKNNWGDGSVQKLFNQLNENISIGNPTFAKNTGNIIAFDVIDDNDKTYAIYGKNTVTGKSDEIVTNVQVGFPNYSNKDDKLIYDSKNTLGNEVLAVVGLAGDKISSTSTGTVLIDEAKWGTWYADGNRNLLSSGNDILSFDFPGLNPPATGQISGTNVVVNNVPAGNIPNLTPVFKISPRAKAFVSNNEQISGVNTHDFGTPVQYTIKAEDGSLKVYNVTVNASTGSVRNASLQKVQLYPNPVKDELQIEGRFESYTVYDYTGKVISEGNAKIIDTGHFVQGTYFITFTTSEGQRLRAMFVKGL